MYGKVSAEIVALLREIVGEENVIFDDPEGLEAYSHDELSEKEYAHMPEVVVKPRSTEEVSLIMKLAANNKIPVTPRGAGTGLSGGAVPVCGGILLSVENMNRILEIDLDNLMVVVEPGRITADINEALQEHGLFYAGYPMSLQECFIGGNVAENAGGGHAVKYGVTGRYVVGLEVVLPSGEIVEFGGKRVKDVTGYNMVQLMVGSEGTLGIFTKIILKLLPRPAVRIDLLALFDDIQRAIDVVPLIFLKEKLIPAGIEFMDRLCMSTAYEYLEEKMPYPETDGALLITMDGTNVEQVRVEARTITELLRENGAVEVHTAETPDAQEKLWKVRRNVGDALKALSSEHSMEDVVVPVASISKVMPCLTRLSEKYDVLIPCFGHAGDGNLHVSIIKKKDDTTKRWQEVLPEVLVELYKSVYELGGTISGEHGIGHKRKDSMPLVLTDVEIELMKRIKFAFDPDNILNPGKMFP
ncbi:FAD-binding protein [Dehalococcoidia bacterium]|nr:FAD-binding protein [Dehalococcoidia bacterium]